MPSEYHSGCRPMKATMTEEQCANFKLGGRRECAGCTGLDPQGFPSPIKGASYHKVYDSSVPKPEGAAAVMQSEPQREKKPRKKRGPNKKKTEPAPAPQSWEKIDHIQEMEREQAHGAVEEPAPEPGPGDGEELTVVLVFRGEDAEIAREFERLAENGHSLEENVATILHMVVSGQLKIR